MAITQWRPWHLSGVGVAYPPLYTINVKMKLNWIKFSTIDYYSNYHMWCEKLKLSSKIQRAFFKTWSPFNDLRYTDLNYLYFKLKYLKNTTRVLNHLFICFFECAAKTKDLWWRKIYDENNLRQLQNCIQISKTRRKWWFICLSFNHFLFQQISNIYS